MKILYLCPDPGVYLANYNGSARHVRSIVRALVALGHDVEVALSRTDGATELGVPVHEIAPSPLAARLVGLVPRGAGDRGRGVARALRHVWHNAAVERVAGELIGRRRPDLVYERHSPFCVAGAASARELGVTHVLEVNAPLAWEGARHRGQELVDAAEVLEQAAFAATERIVAVSDELRDQLVAAGVPAAKIRVVPNAVDPSLFTADGPVRDDFPVGRVVVGFVGSLKAWHGLDLLLDAFGELLRHADAHLLVVGDGPLAGMVREFGARHPGRVTLTGAVHPSDVPAYLRTMDVSVAPYPLLERFYFSPLKVLESMACGTPVVASHIGQLARLIRDGETGLLVPPGDTAALAHGLKRLVQDGRWRRRLGRAAAAAVRVEHTWSRRAEEIVRLAAVAA